MNLACIYIFYLPCAHAIALILCVVSDHFFHSDEFVVYTYIWSDLFCNLYLCHLHVCNAVTQHFKRALSLREVCGMNYII